MRMVEQARVGIFPQSESELTPNVAMGHVRCTDDYVGRMFSSKPRDSAEDRIAIGEMFEGVQERDGSDRSAFNYCLEVREAFIFTSKRDLVRFNSAFA